MKHGFPMLSSSSIAGIVNRPIAQSPIQSMYTDPLKPLMSTVTAMNVAPAPRRSATTSCGTLCPRDHPTLSRPLVMQPDGTADSSGENCSLEQALFPHPFPFNTGAWDGAVSICTYLRLRCSQLFSPFTLCKSYLLLMYHVRQAHLLSQNCSSTMLQRDIDRYTTEHPHATQQQIMQHVLKHTVPSTVPGSPAWFRRELQNLNRRCKLWVSVTHRYVELMHIDVVPPKAAVHLAGSAHLIVRHAMSTDCRKLCMITNENEEYLICTLLSCSNSYACLAQSFCTIKCNAR